jgi:acyl dehydratase
MKGITMSPLPPVGPNAKYFEDFRIGDSFKTQGRTFTAADGLFWSMYSGDMNPMHVDDDFAEQYGIFGGLFPPGLAVVGIASGLNERLGLFSGTGLAMTKQSINYRKPVLPGETIHNVLTVLSLKPHPKRPAGTVEFGYEITKSDGTIAIDGSWEIFLATRDYTTA